MIKVCIIGCGMIAGSAHLPAYRACRDFEVAAVFDINEEAARKTALEHGVPYVYNDCEKMLKEQRPDVVSVCVPNLLHKEYTLLALRYGAHVLCEKPLAFTLAEAEELFEYAAACGKHLMACQTLRFLPERLAACALREQMGEVYHAEVSRIRRRGIPTWGKFHLKDYSGGGALLDIGVHAIDSALWLMGNPKPLRVTARMKQVHLEETGSAEGAGDLKGVARSKSFRPEEMDVESFASGMVDFENGATLAFKVAWSANLKEENNIVLAGEHCGIDLAEKTVLHGIVEEPLAVTPNGFSEEPFFGHFCLVQNMADVLLRGAEPFIKPEETLNVTAILEAAYRSAEQGKEIQL